MKFLLVSFAIFMAVNAASVEPESPHPNEAPSKTDSPTAKDGASGTPLVHGDHNLIPFPEFDKPPPQQPRERRGWLARAAGNVADTARLVSQVVVSGVNFVRGLVYVQYFFDFYFLPSPFFSNNIFPGPKYL